MAAQFLYDDDGRTPISRQFNVYPGKPVIIKAGALTGPVAIYMSVGDCVTCNTDHVWQPLTMCGSAVVVSPDTSVIGISVPGLYYLGDPLVDPLNLGPNVNVTIEVVNEVPSELANCVPVVTESISEITVCVNGLTTIRKTVIDSNGVEDINFYGDNGIVITPKPTVFTIGPCAVVEKDHGWEILCDPVTNARIVVEFSRNEVTNILDRTATTMGGTPWAGNLDDLVTCDTPDMESDPISWCAAGVNVLQHVLKIDGTPTGDVFWTNAITGSVITAPVAPTLGTCSVQVLSETAVLICAGGVSMKEVVTKLSNGTEVKEYFTQDGASAVTPAQFTYGACQDLEVLGCVPLPPNPNVKLSIVNKTDTAEMSTWGNPWDQMTFIGQIDAASVQHPTWYVHELCGDPSLVGATDQNGFLIQLGGWQSNPDLDPNDPFDTIVAPVGFLSCPIGGKTTVKVIQRDDGLGGKTITKVYDIDANGTLVDLPTWAGLTIGACSIDANSVTMTGAARFAGPATIDAPLLLSTAPAGSKLSSVAITVRVGSANIEGSIPLPAGASVLVANPNHNQMWAATEDLNLDNFTYTLSNGCEVDVIWAVET